MALEKLLISCVHGKRISENKGVKRKTGGFNKKSTTWDDLRHSQGKAKCIKYSVTNSKYNVIKMKQVNYRQNRRCHDRIVSLNVFLYVLEGKTNMMKISIDGTNEMK